MCIRDSFESGLKNLENPLFLIFSAAVAVVLWRINIITAYIVWRHILGTGKVKLFPQTGIESRSSRISPPSYHISLENNDAYLNPYGVGILFMSIKFGWQWPFRSVQCKCKVWLLDNRKFSIRKQLIGGELKTFWMQSKLLKLSLRYLYERKSLNYLQSWFHSTYVIVFTFDFSSSCEVTSYIM